MCPSAKDQAVARESAVVSMSASRAGVAASQAAKVALRAIARAAACGFSGLEMAKKAGGSAVLVLMESPGKIRCRRNVLIKF